MTQKNEKKSKKVLVTGATGMVGKKLCEALFKRGYSIIAVTRDAGSKSQQAKLGVPAEWVEWKGLTRYCENHTVDFVVHLAGEPIASGLWTQKKKAAILKSRTESTKNLFSALKKNPPQKIISASAIGYYGDRGNEILTEASGPGSLWVSEVCKKWEETAIAHCPKNSELSILRIGVVLGNPGGMLDLLAPLFASGLGGPIGFGKQYLSWIHIYDLVNLAIHLLEKDARSEKTGSRKGLGKPALYNAVSPHPVTNKEFSKTLARIFGKPALLPTPPQALKLALGELSSIILSSQRVEPKAALELENFTFQFTHLPSALRQLFPYSFYTARLERSQWLNHSVQKVFTFFSSETNLEKITPKFLNFKVVRKSTPQLQEGTRIDYQLKLHGFPMQWRSKIEDWQPNQEFVDTQEKGPYAFWHHRHLFESVEEGTLIRDVVHYKLPLLPLIHLILKPLVSKDLDKIFSYRYTTIEEIFGNAEPDHHK